MTNYYGDYPEDHAAIRIPFNTFTSDDPAASSTITNLADSDIHVHKDGSLTQIATDGASVVINFDGITGNHMILIDSSVHADYSTGSEYAVRIEGTTVDGATINAWIGAFSIERAGGVLALMKATTLASIKAETALIVGDTNELQTDWVNGGRLDLLLDAIPTTAMRGTENAATAASLATAQTDLDTITGSDGVTLATAQGLYAPNKVVPDAAGVAATQAEVATEIASYDGPTNTEMVAAFTEIKGSTWATTDTLENIRDELVVVDTVADGIQTDLSNATDGLGAIKADTAATLVDTNELQTDDIPGTIAALNDVSTAQVNTEVVDALNVDTYAEPAQGIPAATASLVTKIGFLYKAWRNKTTTTATQYNLYNDDTTTIDHKATLADDATTGSKTEVVSGP